MDPFLVQKAKVLKMSISFLLGYIYMIQPPLVPPTPPPKGGYGTHMQPCIGITICFYWFMYVCLCVCLSVCWYVSMCVSQQGRHVIVFVSAHKDTTCTHNVRAPPCGWVGGSYHLQPCIGITICFYWFMYDNYCLYWFMVCLYVCIYVSKQGRHVIVFCVCTQRYYIYT